MTSPREERHAIMALQAAPTPSLAVALAAPKVEEWLTPRGKGGRPGAAALFSPDCAPQCRREVAEEEEGAAVSPTTYRAEPMEAEDLPVRRHDTTCSLPCTQVTFYPPNAQKIGLLAWMCRDKLILVFCSRRCLCTTTTA